MKKTDFHQENKLFVGGINPDVIFRYILDQWRLYKKIVLQVWKNNWSKVNKQRIIFDMLCIVLGSKLNGVSFK